MFYVSGGLPIKLDDIKLNFVVGLFIKTLQIFFNIYKASSHLHKTGFKS